MFGEVLTVVYIFADLDYIAGVAVVVISDVFWDLVKYEIMSTKFHVYPPLFLRRGPPAPSGPLGPMEVRVSFALVLTTKPLSCNCESNSRLYVIVLSQET